MQSQVLARRCVSAGTVGDKRQHAVTSSAAPGKASQCSRSGAMSQPQALRWASCSNRSNGENPQLFVEPRIAAPVPLVAMAAAAVLLSPGLAQALPQAQLEQIKQTIDQDFQDGQYYVTGKLTKDIYAPDCRFKDPTTDVKGVEPYTTAVAALFDPAVSKADLISSEISGPNSITLRWRLEGKLKLGNLPIKPYTGTTVYTMDESSGKITGHTETWDISALDAFVSTLLPGFGAPPAAPVSK